jgi:hypothetical protein
MICDLRAYGRARRGQARVAPLSPALSPQSGARGHGAVGGVGESVPCAVQPGILKKANENEKIKPN